MVSGKVPGARDDVIGAYSVRCQRMAGLRRL